jgi:urocanate hydratase
MVLDGSDRAAEIIACAMMWDVMGGVARRSWARNENAITTSAEYNRNYDGKGHITLPMIPTDALVEDTVNKAFKDS